MRQFALSTLAATLAAPALADIPEPAPYYCALTDQEVIEAGQRDPFETAYDDERRPALVYIPRRDDPGLIAEEASPDGTVYTYARQVGAGLEAYMIHGSFDLSTGTLITSRSILLPTESGIRVPEAAAFVYLCEPA